MLWKNRGGSGGCLVLGDVPLGTCLGQAGGVEGSAGAESCSSALPGAGGGGGGGAARWGEEEPRRTHEPHIVGPAGWSRSIPCDFIEARQGRGGGGVPYCVRCKLW